LIFREGPEHLVDSLLTWFIFINILGLAPVFLRLLPRRRSETLQRHHALKALSRSLKDKLGSKFRRHFSMVSFISSGHPCRASPPDQSLLFKANA
jgi:hypothetical protein